MGNCMETLVAAQKPQAEEKQDEEDRDEENLGGLQKDESMDDNNRRIKIVLTKLELEWLMFQLKDKEGKNLEDALEEIERNRGNGGSAIGWKPSLESITECPDEVQEMLR